MKRVRQHREARKARIHTRKAKRDAKRRSKAASDREAKRARKVLRRWWINEQRDVPKWLSGNPAPHAPPEDNENDATG